MNKKTAGIILMNAMHTSISAKAINISKNVMERRISEAMITFPDLAKDAAPWLAMGLALAIFLLSSASKKKKKRSHDEFHNINYSAEGMSLGMCFGIAIGTALGSTAIGLSLGMLVGIAVGSCIWNDTEE